MYFNLIHHCFCVVTIGEEWCSITHNDVFMSGSSNLRLTTILSGTIFLGNFTTSFGLILKRTCWYLHWESSTKTLMPIVLLLVQVPKVNTASHSHHRKSCLYIYTSHYTVIEFYLNRIQIHIKKKFPPLICTNHNSSVIYIILKEESIISFIIWIGI